MITCLICKEPVKSVDFKEHLEDGSNADFYCEGYDLVGVHEIPHCHYFRQTAYGCQPEYTVVVDPFRFTWYEKVKLVRVEKIEPYRSSEVIKFYEEVEWEDFPKTVEKFKNLRVFL